jgi:hypothetical protein
MRIYVCKKFISDVTGRNKYFLPPSFSLKNHFFKSITKEKFVVKNDLVRLLATFWSIFNENKFFLQRSFIFYKFRYATARITNMHIRLYSNIFEYDIRIYIRIRIRNRSKIFLYIRIRIRNRLKFSLIFVFVFELQNKYDYLSLLLLSIEK